jgi:SAM-dependent methyltransferase
MRVFSASNWQWPTIEGHVNFEVDVKRQQEFYDGRWQSATRGSAERSRIAFTVSAVPESCKRVLDVGCGDGRVSTELASGSDRSVVALDLSMVALKRLSVPGCCGSAERLPFLDKSFDLVMATEALEHMPKSTYPAVLNEMARVARHHILITVPNNENLTENVAVCGECGTKAHRWGHMRSYNAGGLANMFCDFRCLRVEAFGENDPRYNKCLLWLRQTVAGSWISDESDRCYACGARYMAAPRWPFLARVCDATNARFWAPLFKQPSWLLALYVRDSA